jgi:hypothetical protein
LKLRNINLVDYVNKVDYVEQFSSVVLPIHLIDGNGFDVVRGIISPGVGTKVHAFSIFFSWFYLNRFFSCDSCCSSIICFFGWCWRGWSPTMNSSSTGKRK